MIDFEIPADLAARRDEVLEFVSEQVVPFETDPRMTQHGPTEDLRNELVDLARKAGLLTFQAAQEGQERAATHLEQAILFEAAGWSALGPVALNCAAPDEGNMFLLDKIADPAQAEEFLWPMIAGRQRSVFAMTEPGGAGSDPRQLATTAVRDGDGYVINGRKWLITGANGAKTWIIMADLEGAGATLFLCHGDTPGIVIERTMDTMDRNYVEGHCVVLFDDLHLPATALLGEEGEAFRYAQLRLAPARLTHCMRWLGGAVRAQSIAVDYAKTRTAFGKPIGQHQGVGFMLADNEIAIQKCRLMIWWACWILDQGQQGRHESSMVKAMVSEELFKVADRCVQVLGGMGISDETPVAGFFRDVRAFRLYDGPTEVHQHAIASRILRD
ncbi:acyl-CoA dehydrogenase family protein [Nocardioides pelophilus]|uniref:acyl-CoA dehydrogenase family protein n=1 Tax=Nocardioides pelophilus TaxID=2172019 RepID=UPI001601E526|nr:acyl-CoA dehydrogenase family protein [Nocardioides pelophilus]